MERTNYLGATSCLHGEKVNVISSIVVNLDIVIKYVAIAQRTANSVIRLILPPAWSNLEFLRSLVFSRRIRYSMLLGIRDHWCGANESWPMDQWKSRNLPLNRLTQCQKKNRRSKNMNRLFSLLRFFKHCFLAVLMFLFALN